MASALFRIMGSVGVVSSLQGRRFRLQTPEFGETLETYLMHDLTCHSDYVSQEPLRYWRSTTGLEVNFIHGDHTAIEVKSKENVLPQDLSPCAFLRRKSN